MIARVESLLGRRLDPGKFRSVLTLNALSPAMVDDLRRLARAGGPSWADWYLRLHMRDPAYRAHLAEFMRDVVAAGADPATWGRQDVLVIVAEADVLETSAAGIRAELADLDGARWRRVTVADAAEVLRRAEDGSWGAPGVHLRQVPYNWRSGRASTMGLSVAGTLSGHPVGPLEDVPEERFEIAVRRWIALRLASWARRAGVALAGADVGAILAARGADPRRVTRDARIAIGALLAEDPTGRGKVPGFIGPDALYAG